MHYLVKLSSGKTLCNIAEIERAINICKAYPDSYIIDLKGNIINRIDNIKTLANLIYDTTIDNVKQSVIDYTDYKTDINWTNEKITLTVYVPDTSETLTKELSFPFTDAEYHDRITGLQCWADYKRECNELANE